MLVIYGVVFLGAFSEITNDAMLKIACSGFFLSRCLCGISVISFPLAKKDGMLFTFADSSHKKIVKGSLYLQSIACIGFMMFWSIPAGLVAAVAAVAFLGYYFCRSRKEFGGVTGDTAGWFGVLCEGCIVVVTALMDIICFPG